MLLWSVLRNCAMSVNMRFMYSSALVAAVLLSGCSSVRVNERSTAASDLQPIIDEARGGTVDIKLRSGRTMAVGGLHAEGATMAWDSPVRGSTPASEIREATITHHGKGFWEGLAIGAGAGFVTGFATGVIWNTTCSEGPFIDGGHPQSSCPFTTGPSLSGGLQLCAILGGLFAIPGAVIGGIFGAVRGDRTTFNMDASPPRQ